MRIKDMSSKEWNKKIVKEMIKMLEKKINRLEFGEEIAYDAEKIASYTIDELKFLIGELEE